MTDSVKHQDVIDNHAVAGVVGIRTTGFEESIPFHEENVHHASTDTRSVFGPKRHDTKCVLRVVR